MIIAGEASGDTLAAELVRELRQKAGAEGSRIEFFGAGGARMAAEGVELRLDLASHAVVGIIEVLKNYRKFKAFFDDLLQLAEDRRPEVVILVDYPGFNLRFAKALKERAATISGWKPRVIFYVSPQIWAWHESRIHQIARDIDLLLTIFPFEKDWYRARKPDFRVEFVGHPLVDRFRDFSAPAPLPPSAGPVVALLPGSRVRELRKHLPAMIEGVRLLQAERKLDVRMVLPNEALKELARSFLSGNDSVTLQIGGLAETLSIAAIAIASSGTVTMECAYFRVPTVVIYRTSASTYFLGRRFIKVKYLAMPNLLAERELYPELIQHEVTGEKIAIQAGSLLIDPARREEIKRELDRVIASLGSPGASGRAASAILLLMKSANHHERS